MTLTRYERYDILNKIANALEERVDEVSRMITGWDGGETGLCFKGYPYEPVEFRCVAFFSYEGPLDDDSQCFLADVQKMVNLKNLLRLVLPWELI